MTAARVTGTKTKTARNRLDDARGRLSAERVAAAARIAALERDIARYATAGQAQGLTRRWTAEDVIAPAPYRLYRATVSQHWVLDPHSSPDDRAEVAL